MQVWCKFDQFRFSCFNVIKLTIDTNFPKIAFLGSGGPKMDISNENYKLIFLIGDRL